MIDSYHQSRTAAPLDRDPHLSRQAPTGQTDQAKATEAELAALLESIEHR